MPAKSRSSRVESFGVFPDIQLWRCRDRIWHLLFTDQRYKYVWNRFVRSYCWWVFLWDRVRLVIFFVTPYYLLGILEAVSSVLESQTVISSCIRAGRIVHSLHVALSEIRQILFHLLKHYYHRDIYRHYQYCQHHRSRVEVYCSQYLHFHNEILLYTSILYQREIFHNRVCDGWNILRSQWCLLFVWEKRVFHWDKRGCAVCLSRRRVVPDSWVYPENWQMLNSIKYRIIPQTRVPLWA